MHARTLAEYIKGKTHPGKALTWSFPRANVSAFSPLIPSKINNRKYDSHRRDAGREHQNKGAADDAAKTAARGKLQ